MSCRATRNPGEKKEFRTLHLNGSGLPGVGVHMRVQSSTRLVVQLFRLHFISLIAHLECGGRHTTTCAPIPPLLLLRACPYQRTWRLFHRALVMPPLVTARASSISREVLHAMSLSPPRLPRPPPEESWSPWSMLRCSCMHALPLALLLSPI